MKTTALIVKEVYSTVSHKPCRYLIKKISFFLFLILSLNAFGQNKNPEVRINVEQVYKKYDVKLRPYINKLQNFRNIHDKLPSDKRLDYALKISNEEDEALDILSKGEKSRLEELKKLLDNLKTSEHLVEKAVADNHQNYQFDVVDPVPFSQFVKTLIISECKEKYSKYFELHNSFYSSRLLMYIDADGRIKDVRTEGENEEFNVLSSLLLYSKNLKIKPLMEGGDFVLSEIEIRVREY
ncbi:hypothetical protein PFY12_06470 [Chryseobacterium camelliae]|uniref:TonB C-terminal domain-containing protein n=1 Tax=Chryseobacterium camelliae TaxID=1265445 RepID=A0ABY7QQ63_9FLAO|nr:hypothetical protein [Chryseobacterium camelliae]WBV61762.1 hypothetical protein PFY12_06470 [Chryseobacterium camelliae]